MTARAPRPALPSSVTLAPSTSSASPQRRSPSRLWSQFVGGHLAKSISRDDDGDHVMRTDEALEPITVFPPASLPRCSLKVSFKTSDSNVHVPPAFYPGHAIPTVLTFHLDRDSALPHCLNPTLTMSLVGTLDMPNTPTRTIICVSVSLAEGLELWARDAQQAYARRSPPRTDLPVDPQEGLPGGTYSLPLTVQVPLTPRLPPSFCVPGASFAVNYALNVALTCDDPLRLGQRIILADISRPFEMMPVTMPTHALSYSPLHMSVRGHAAKSVSRRPSTRWLVEPSLPTTAFSPTSVIPVSLRLTPPASLDPPTPYQIFIRLTLVRREHSSQAFAGIQDPSSQVGLLHEEEIITRHGYAQTDGVRPLQLRNILLPLLLDGNHSWRHGFSTMLNVGGPPSSSAGQPNLQDETLSMSSTFHLAITIGFLPLVDGSSMEDCLGPLPPIGQFSEPCEASNSHINLPYLQQHFPGTIRTLPLSLVVGSVSEPTGAMHNVRWSDLHLDRRDGQEVGRMIHGEGVSCEDGWIVPPPSYTEACEVVPYAW